MKIQIRQINLPLLRDVSLGAQGIWGEGLKNGNGLRREILATGQKTP